MDRFPVTRHRPGEFVGPCGRTSVLRGSPGRRGRGRPGPGPGVRPAGTAGGRPCGRVRRVASPGGWRTGHRPPPEPVADATRTGSRARRSGSRLRGACGASPRSGGAGDGPDGPPVIVRAGRPPGQPPRSVRTAETSRRVDGRSRPLAEGEQVRAGDAVAARWNSTRAAVAAGDRHGRSRTAATSPAERVERRESGEQCPPAIGERDPLLRGRWVEVERRAHRGGRPQVDQFRDDAHLLAGQPDQPRGRRQSLVADRRPAAETAGLSRRPPARTRRELARLGDGRRYARTKPEPFPRAWPGPSASEACSPASWRARSASDTGPGRRPTASRRRRDGPRSRG